MAPERFEELPVWKYSIDLARRVLRCTSHPAMAKHPEFARQLENNALGIGNQIVTAVSSHDPRSLADGIAMARICTARTRSMLHLLESGKRDQTVSDVDKMKTLADRVERYLTGWLRSLTEDPTRRPKATSAPATPPATPPATKEKIDLADLVELRDPSPATSNEPSADDTAGELIAEAEPIEEPADGDALNPLEALARAASDSAEKTETPSASPKQGSAAPAAKPPQPAAPSNASPAANTSQLEEVLAELAGQSEDPFASLPDEKKN